MSSERVTNTIYVDGNGVVGNNRDNGFPDIVMDLDRYRIGPRTQDFPKEPTIIAEPPFVSNASETPLPSVTDSSLDQGEITIAETSPEKPKKAHWVTQALLDYDEAKSQGTIPSEVLEVLEKFINPIKIADLYRKHRSGVDILSMLGVIRTPIPVETKTKTNYWGGGLSSDQSDNQDQAVEQQIQADRNYAAGWMRIAGVLEFISETELTPTDRQLIYELYESGDLPYTIAMDTVQNHYQAMPREFLKRIKPYLLPYRKETITEELAILFINNPTYQESYRNIVHTVHTITGLYFEGRLPLNITLLPREEFDKEVSLGIRTHDIDNFDYINRANRRMEKISPAEKEKILQIISNDPQYHINDSYFVRQKRIERAFNKVKGPLLEKVRLGVVDLFNRRSTSRPYELIEAAQ